MTDREPGPSIGPAEGVRAAPSNRRDCSWVRDMRKRLMLAWTRSVPVVLTVAILAARADGGPARYNKETKSFEMAYTFANLDPSVLGAFQDGPPLKPTEAQDAA